MLEDPEHLAIMRRWVRLSVFASPLDRLGDDRFLDPVVVDALLWQFLACREAEFLQLLDHPNIVECIEVVENEKQMVIIMEWLRGGHLLDNLEEMAGQHYSEQQASVLFVQVNFSDRRQLLWCFLEGILFIDMGQKSLLWTLQQT